MLKDIKEHLKGSAERETELLKIQSDLEEKVKESFALLFSCIVISL